MIEICNLCEYWGVGPNGMHCVHPSLEKYITLETVTDYKNQVYVMTPNNCPLRNEQ